MRKVCVLWILVLGIFWALAMGSPALAAYSSHQNDQDINNFLSVTHMPSPPNSMTVLFAIRGVRSAREPMVVVTIATRFIRPKNRMAISY